jgi:hypothetical protein
MRRVVLVPLVHDEADLGTAGPTLLAETIRLAGPERWAAHTETLTRYWTEVAAFLQSMDPSRLKLYQDGLPVGGPVARAVVEEAARRGSRNYRLLLDLIDRGAELRRTEDPELLRQEYDLLARETSTTRPVNGKRNEQRTVPDPEKPGRLLRERDEFIARTIDATLEEGEVGILFLGAEHQATARLAPDIVVQPLKDPRLVKAYFQALLAPGHGRERVRLASYLVSPIR